MKELIKNFCNRYFTEKTQPHKIFNSVAESTIMTSALSISSNGKKNSQNLIIISLSQQIFKQRYITMSLKGGI